MALYSQEIYLLFANAKLSIDLDSKVIEVSKWRVVSKVVPALSVQDKALPAWQWTPHVWNKRY